MASRTWMTPSADHPNRTRSVHHNLCSRGVVLPDPTLPGVSNWIKHKCGSGQLRCPNVRDVAWISIKRFSGTVLGCLRRGSCCLYRSNSCSSICRAPQKIEVNGVIEDLSKLWWPILQGKPKSRTLALMSPGHLQVAVARAPIPSAVVQRGHIQTMLHYVCSPAGSHFRVRPHRKFPTDKERLFFECRVDHEESQHVNRNKRNGPTWVMMHIL